MSVYDKCLRGRLSYGVNCLVRCDSLRWSDLISERGSVRGTREILPVTEPLKSRSAQKLLDRNILLLFLSLSSVTSPSVIWLWFLSSVPRSCPGWFLWMRRDGLWQPTGLHLGLLTFLCLSSKWQHCWLPSVSEVFPPVLVTLPYCHDDGQVQRSLALGPPSP